MKILAVLDEAAFGALPDETVLGKDSYIKDEKANNFKLALSGEEAGKLALPLSQQLDNKKADLKRLHEEKKELEDKLKAYEALGKTPEEIGEVLKTGKTADVEAVEKEYKAKIESINKANESALNAAKAELEAERNGSAETKKQLQQTVKRTLIAELKNKFDMNALGDDYLSNRIEVVYDEDTKQYLPRVMENGQEAYKGGVLKTPEQLAEEARANRDLAGMFNAGAGGGSGAQNNQAKGAKRAGTILESDQAGLSANLEEIAKGEIQVV